MISGNILGFFSFQASRCQILRTASAFMKSKRKVLARAKLIKASVEGKKEKGKKGETVLKTELFDLKSVRYRHVEELENWENRKCEPSSQNETKSQAGLLCAVCMCTV